MRLAALGRFLFGALLVGSALGQDNNDGNDATSQNQTSPSVSTGGQNSMSPSPTPTRAPGNNTTVAPSIVVSTRVVANANGEGSMTQFVTITPSPTATTNATSTAPANSTMSINSTTFLNGTSLNGTDSNSTVVWNDTLPYLPFKPPIDAAYGIGGGLLILTGIPVGTLGGKNRWSALAIISGYSVGLFCLVMILSFGVTPALQPPSPSVPSAAMRGLYLLATVISFLVGSGLGIFFFTFAKYWVGTAGGFTFGWYLLALRKGGLVNGVGPRWAILGSCTVAASLAALMPFLHEYLLLIASAWVGATAFTLGVDCFTRAGLKEFYMYNLGFESAFQSLNGGKFPLTQNMQVELGVIAATALIAGAIQFKLVNTLQRRRKELAAKEAARLEAAEIDRAAEHFKNVDAELAEWEGKHGISDSSSNTIVAPILNKGNAPPNIRPLSSYTQGKQSMESPPMRTAPLGDKAVNRRSLMEERLSLLGNRDSADLLAAPSTPLDPELEQKLQLLAEVRRARQSIRSSMDHLSSSQNTPNNDGDADRADSPTRSRRDSNSSSMMLDRGRYDSGASSIVLNKRSPSTSNALLLDDNSRRNSLNVKTLIAADDAPRPSAEQSSAVVDWQKYVQSRNIVGPASVSQASPPAPQPAVEQFAIVSNSVNKALNQRGGDAARSSSIPQPPTAVTSGRGYGEHLTRAIPANELAAAAATAASGDTGRAATSAPRRVSRAMTTDELAERHREMLTRMQDRVSGPIREEKAIAEAKDAWEKRQRAEREEQARRRESREKRGEVPRVAAMVDASASKPVERARRTEEWRRSVTVTSPPPAQAGPSARRQSGAPAVATVVPPARPTSPPRRHSGAPAAAPPRPPSPARRHSGTRVATSVASPARQAAARRASRQNFIA